MNPNDALLWTHTPPKRVPKPGETLFAFVRQSDGAPMHCELRFRGESFGWEAQLFERGHLSHVHGAWVTRAAAIAGAAGERDRLTKKGWLRMGPAPSRGTPGSPDPDGRTSS